MSDRPTPDTILQEALDLTGRTERAAYLDEVCGKDAALRDEIDSLLAAHFEADAFMDTLVDPLWQETTSEKEGGAIAIWGISDLIAKRAYDAKERKMKVEWAHIAVISTDPSEGRVGHVRVPSPNNRN